MNAHLLGYSDNPRRGRLRTRTGRFQDVMLLGVIHDQVGGSQLTLHLDDLCTEDLIGGPDETLEVDLRDGRRFAVVCVGINLGDRTAVFTTRDLPATDFRGGRAAQFRCARRACS